MPFLILTAALAMTVFPVGVRRLRAGLKGTTLITAWWTLAAAFLIHFAVWIVSVLGLVPAEAATHLWYGVTVLLLCPPVAVLGARKPVADAWPWFVLIPLVFVFAIPSFTVLWRGGWTTPLQIETPTLLGIAFILTMGAGNYLFTRFTFAALLYAAGVALMLIPATSVAGRLEWDAAVWPQFGTVTLGTAMLAGLLAARRRPQQSDLETAWIAFRDTFGIVWAKRIMDRVNWSAEEEEWTLRIGLTGIVLQDGESADHERSRQRLDEVFRWLLKRFVDEGWIDRRL